MKEIKKELKKEYNKIPQNEIISPTFLFFANAKNKKPTMWGAFSASAML